MESLKALWEFVQTAGPAGIFAVMWWLERKERLEKDKELDAMAKEMVKAASETATALTAIKDVVTTTRGRR